MKYICILLLSGIYIMSSAQQHWTMGEKYLKLNGQPVFMNGVNYIPSDNWLMVLENWKPEVIEEDLATLKANGVDYIRFCPLWNLTQPGKNKFNEEVFKRIDYVFKVAEETGIMVQIAPITGWMSGGVFLPSWANGELFTDLEIIEGQVNLVTEVARRYKDSPALQGYDFGNEINVLLDRMKLKGTPEEVKEWMNTIYKAYQNEDPDHYITNGSGTGFNRFFNIWSISETSDYMSVHTYPYFHGTWDMDPWLGMRTSYSPNFVTAWAEMMGKPVLVQEIGASEAWMDRLKIPQYLRVTYYSTWADGAAGYWWWCSHNIDRDYKVKSDGLYTEYSISTFEKGNFSELEYELGLLDINNQVKPVGKAFKKCTETVNKLGLNWKDVLPTLYIIIPEKADYYETMLNFITPYVLAKQIHMDIKLWPEWEPLPADAIAAVVPGFALSEKGRNHVQGFLENGGKVLQSFYHDFGNFKSEGTPYKLKDPEITVVKREGLTELGQPLNARGNVEIKKVFHAKNAEIIMNTKDNQGNEHGILYKTQVGEGCYYYLAANWEKALKEIYHPWPEDDAHLVYSVLRPDNIFQVDNKYVEFYHKQNKDTNLLIFINHSDEFQPVQLSSDRPHTFTNVLTGENLATERDLSLHLEPGGAAFVSFPNNNDK